MYLPTFTTLILLVQWFGLSSAIKHDFSTAVKRQSGSSSSSTVPQYSMSMPVDHFNKADTRRFSNRYWLNDTYYRPGGPVFLLDAGEGAIESASANCHLGEAGCTSSIMRLAAKYNGVAIFFEHRYYGESLPVPMNLTTGEPVEGMSGYKYLNVEQSLEDVVYFAKNFRIPGCKTENICTAVTPSRTPWIWLGGSYPGIRGALIRVRNPEIFYAVWASSAPVQAVYDGSIYYNTIEASMPANCTADVRAAVKYADEIMAGKYGNTALKELERLMDIGDILKDGINTNYSSSNKYSWAPYNIGQSMASALIKNFQYGGPTPGTHRLCNYIQSYNPNARPANSRDQYIRIYSNPGTRVADSRGIAANYNSSVALQAYFYAWRRWHGDSSGAAPSASMPWEVPGSVEGKSWGYQVMTEFGWFQASNPANVTIVSKFFNYTARHAEAAHGFSDPSALPAVPNVNAFNKYGGWNMNPSNVMFTNGEHDPWRSGSPASNQPWIDAPLRAVVQDVPTCGKSPAGNNVFGLTYAGKVHVPDLTQSSGAPWNAVSSNVFQGFQLFSKALDQWLPCFKATPGNTATGTTTSTTLSTTPSVTASATPSPATSGSWKGYARRSFVA